MTKKNTASTEDLPVIGIRHPGNPQCRAYYPKVDPGIARISIENFEKPLRGFDVHGLKKLGPVGEKLVRRIMAIPAVSAVWIHFDHLSVIAREMYSIGDIESQVLDIIMYTLGWEKALLVPLGEYGRSQASRRIYERNAVENTAEAEIFEDANTSEFTSEDVSDEADTPNDDAEVDVSEETNAPVGNHAG